MKYLNLYSIFMLVFILSSCSKDDDKDETQPTTETPEQVVDYIQLDFKGTTYKFDNPNDFTNTNIYYKGSKFIELDYSGGSISNPNLALVWIDSIDLDNPKFPATYDSKLDGSSLPRIGIIIENEKFLSGKVPIGVFPEVVVNVSSFTDNRLIGSFEGVVYDDSEGSHSVTNGKFEITVKFKN